MKRIEKTPLDGETARRKHRHFPIRKGTTILLLDGTKIIDTDGQPHIVAATYCIDLSYDSSADEEYIFWHGQRVKKSNIRLCQRVW